MNDTQIAEIWVFFKEYLRKEDISVAAESFVDLLADFGVKDKVLENALGTDSDLDNAIEYYLEDDSEEEEYDEGYDDDDY
jgi:uncharacterized protein with von Willebrand factor type A (vWA) domain